MSLFFHSIDIESPYYSDADRIFRMSFPTRAAISSEDFIRMSSQGNFEHLAITENEELIGFYNALVSDHIVYLFFFAIDPDKRSKGYGSQVLAMLPERYPGRAQLLDMETVDPRASNYEQRCRRRDFYQKNGYYDSGYRISYYGESFTLMTKEAFSSAELEGLLQTVDLDGFSPVITKI